MRRRVRAVHAALLAIVTLMPERFLGVMPTVRGLRAALYTQRVLVALRELAQTKGADVGAEQEPSRLRSSAPRVPAPPPRGIDHPEKRGQWRQVWPANAHCYCTNRQLSEAGA